MQTSFARNQLSTVLDEAFAEWLLAMLPLAQAEARRALGGNWLATLRRAANLEHIRDKLNENFMQWDIQCVVCVLLYLLGDELYKDTAKEANVGAAKSAAKSAASDVGAAKRALEEIRALAAAHTNKTPAYLTSITPSSNLNAAKKLCESLEWWTKYGAEKPTSFRLKMLRALESGGGGASARHAFEFEYACLHFERDGRGNRILLGSGASSSVNAGTNSIQSVGVNELSSVSSVRSTSSAGKRKRDAHGGRGGGGASAARACSSSQQFERDEHENPIHLDSGASSLVYAATYGIQSVAVKELWIGNNVQSTSSARKRKRDAHDDCGSGSGGGGSGGDDGGGDDGDKRNEIAHIIKDLRLLVNRMAFLRHPLIVNVIGGCFVDDLSVPLCIVVERFGIDLATVLAAERDAPAAAVTRAKWAVEVARAMHFCHSHDPPMLHLDLKSANVMIGEIGGERVAKVTDFDSTRSMHDLEAKAKTAWSAPEYLLDGEYSTKCDVWSWGVLLWELIVGEGRQPYGEGARNEAQLNERRELTPALKPQLTVDTVKEKGFDESFFTYFNECLQEKPDRRPHFAHLLPRVTVALNAMQAATSSSTTATSNGHLRKAAPSIPNDFLCPITFEMMSDPVVAADGFTYDRISMEAHFAHQRAPHKSPKTNSVLENTNLVPNRELKALIQDFIEANPPTGKIIYKMAEEGDIDGLRALLREATKDDLNWTDERGFTPLNVASREGHFAIIQELIKAKADIDKANDYGDTPLNSAANKGHIKVVQDLIKAKADIDKADNDGCTPLNSAASNGHNEVVQELIKAKADVDKADIDGWAPLFIAATKGHLEVVRELIKAKADIDKADKDGVTPLNSAANKGHIKVVQDLIKVKADIDKADNNGVTPLCRAVKEGHLEVVKELIKAKADIDKANVNGQTPLYHAVAGGHFKVVQELIKAKADIDKANENGWTPLNSAANEGHLNVVQELIKAKAEIDKANINRWTPLYSASTKGHLEVVQELIKAKADIDKAADYGRTPLNSAACNGHNEVVQELIKAKADINKANNYGWTPLNSAADKGHIKVVQDLIKSKADIDKATVDGWTPLNSAASKGHLEVVKELIKAKPDIDKANKDGATPLFVAAANGHLKVVKELIKAKAGIDKASKNGWTPLNRAASKGHLQVIQELVKAKADMDKATNDGWTPLSIAVDKNLESCARLLLEHDADPLLCMPNNAPGQDFPRSAVYTAIVKDRCLRTLAIAVPRNMCDAVASFENLQYNPDAEVMKRAFELGRSALVTFTYALALYKMIVICGRQNQHCAVKRVLWQRVDSSLPVFEKIAFESLDADMRCELLDTSKRQQLGSMLLNHVNALVNSSAVDTLTQCTNRYAFRRTLFNHVERIRLGE